MCHGVISGQFELYVQSFENICEKLIVSAGTILIFHEYSQSFAQTAKINRLLYWDTARVLEHKSFN